MVEIMEDVSYYAISKGKNNWLLWSLISLLFNDWKLQNHKKKDVRLHEFVRGLTNVVKGMRVLEERDIAR